MVESAESILSKYWGYGKFRPGQDDIVNKINEGKDVLALLPTGGGKSICFQVPALLKPGLTLVISPLIALMKDQVENLNGKGIPSVALHSGLSRDQTNQILNNALNGEYKLLYLSPERFTTQNFKGYLPNLNLSLLVIDEAHCISMWGHDFRPSYQRIAEIRTLLPSIQIAAFTASAPQWIQDDIIEGLQLKSPFVFMGDFRRSNLIFYSFNTTAKQQVVLRLISKSQGSALIFGNTRNTVEAISNWLQSEGISSTFYHAGLAHNERSKRQQDWIENKIRVMVCTNAFGMGVDKPDVRLVVHLAPPKNPEDYYQESGRAGRDGQTSYCILLHSSQDWENIQKGLTQQHPPEPVLRATYHNVLNALQISDGEGALQPFPVDLLGIAKQKQLPPKDLYFAAKALEVVGQWHFVEGNWQPAKVQMVGSHDEVYDFKENSKSLSPLLDILLRGQGGVFDHPVVINEEWLAQRLRSEAEQIKKDLFFLEKRGILRYHPATDLPTIILPEGRSLYPSIHVEGLMKLYQRRVEALQKLYDYAHSNECRSAFWIQYFGGTANDCGKCDNCRKKAESDPMRLARRWWHTTLQGQPQKTSIVMTKIPLAKREILTQGLRTLMDEGCIIENNQGELTWVSE
jgi:ATP-dependent DNA helicase RecQ